MGDSTTTIDFILKYWAIEAFICSGLAFVAYNHPKSYEKISYILYGLGLLALFMGISYDYGISTSQDVLKSLNIGNAEIIKQASTLLHANLIPQYCFNIIFIMNMFLMFLYFLPMMGVVKKD